MNTLLLAPAIFASEGGIERMMRLYLKALCETAGPADSVDLMALNDDGISTDRLIPYSDTKLRSAWGAAGNRWKFTFRALQRSLGCDRVVAGHFNLVPVLGLIRRFRPKLKIYIVAHGTEIWRPWSSKEQRQARRGITFLAVSEFTRNRIKERCSGLRPEQLRVLPNTIDPTLPQIPDAKINRKPDLILSVARLSAADSYKGIDHLIEAMPAIIAARPSARLRIVGKGDDRPRLEALAQKHAPERVEFAGFVPDKDMPAEYARAHLFALPSRDEGFGLVYLEAFILGTPCVAANTGAAHELITAATGACAKYGDVNDLAKTVVSALESEWSEAAIRAHADHYNFATFRALISELQES